MGAEAVALMITVMQQNAADNAFIQQSLINSLELDLEEANKTISRMRHNVQVTLRRPHTDYAVEEALYRQDWLEDHHGC